MKPDLKEKITSRAYWRVNFRPLAYGEPLETLEACEALVERNLVGKRGWDYPHFPRRRDEESNIERADGYVQAWVDWQNHKEFWRMYKSGQFLHYLALREAWLDEDHWFKEGHSYGRLQADGSTIGVIGLNWQLSEVFEFLSRLAESGIYNDGVQVSIALHGTKEKQLVVDEVRRTPFSYPRKTAAERITWERSYAREQISSPRELAVEAIKVFYDCFGWNPSDDQVRADQEELYRLSMGRG